MNYFLNIFALVLVLTFNFGCSKKADFGSGDSGSGVDNGVGDAKPSNNFLWLHHKSVTGALRYTHKVVTSGSWPDQCKVDLDATDPADRDIMCNTESTELDLVHLGLTLEYNVPAHVKCPYVTTMAPFFFQYEPPRDDTIHLEPVYVFVDDNQLTGTYSAAAYYDSAGTTPNPNFSYSKGAYRCGFDYSSGKGPNCCEGIYNETVKTTPSDGSAATFVSSEKTWGGDRSSCLNGPALKLNPSRFGKSSWPSPIVWRLKEQLDGNTTMSSKARFASPIELLGEFKSLADEAVPATGKNFGSFEIGSLINESFGTSRYLATYYSSAQPATAFSDILKYSPFKETYKLLGDPRYYSILCTNYAYEVTARIRLSVREWNTYSALQAATEPTSNEDDNTDAETDFPDYSNQDFLDWEDSAGWMSGVNTYPGGSL